MTDRPLLIDISRLLMQRLRGRLPTGIDRVGQAYLRHYALRARGVLCLGPWCWILPPGCSSRIFRILLAPGTGERATLAGWALWGVLMAGARRDSRGSVLLNTGHFGLERRAYARRLRCAGVRPVVLIHDLLPITHPRYFRAGEGAFHVRRIGHTVLWGSAVIANSQETHEGLRAYCRQHGLSLPPIVVAHLAPGLELPSTPVAPGGAAAVSQVPTFVVLGTLQPRKNHRLLVDLWRRLVRRLGARAPRLLVVGQRGWDCGDLEATLRHDETLGGALLLHSHCDDGELARLLRGARALLFPSFAEGFGLPVVEALSLGVPVIASDLPVLREIAGPVPDYAAPLDVSRWTALIEDYMDPRSPAREAQLRRLAGFRSSTWRDHFAVVDQFLGQLSRFPR